MKITLPQNFNLYDTREYIKLMKAVAVEMKAARPDIFCLANVVGAVSNAVADYYAERHIVVSGVVMQVLTESAALFGREYTETMFGRN